MTSPPAMPEAAIGGIPTAPGSGPGSSGLASGPGSSAPASGPGSSAPVVLLHSEPINILIVDDEPKNLTVLETVLDDPGYRLVRAESADQALLALVAKEFALLILDIRMPGMTGFELAGLIRQRKKTEQLPIIFLTAYYNEDQHVLEGYGNGAVDYLHKPVNAVILRSKVAIFADLHRKNRALEFANRSLVAEVTERREAQEKLRELNETLEQRVLERTEALIEQTKLERLQREQLRASEEFNRSLMEGTADGVQVVDLEGRILLVNGPGRAQLDVDDDAALRGREWLALWPRAATEELRTALDRAQGGTASSLTVLRPTAKGARKWWNVSVSPVRDSANGQVVRLLAVSRDVTKTIETEQALRASDEQKDKFIATLAHELRNPLAPVRNAVMIMRRGDSSDTQLAWCRDVIERQVSQMSRLLEDLLDVARITRAKLTLRQERIELSRLIEQAVEIARPWIDEGRQVFEVTLPTEPVAIDGDITRLAQVISNLLINAAKYTPAGGLLRLTAQPEQADIIVRVQDTGIGIAAEDLTRVFEMFSQVSSSARGRSQGGLGIGLSIARGLVELHGGTLTAHSAGPGMGSEFVVRLPMAKATNGHATADSEAEESGSQPGKICILIVDDLRDSADTVGMLLKSMGHDVHVAYSGEQALRAAEQVRPDVALIDLGMPGVDGYEVCRRIRAQPWGAGVLLIAQTGWGQDVDRRRTQAAGFDQHLTKPVQWELLESLLRSAAARGGRGSVDRL